MKPALLLVDVQNDYLARRGLYPAADHLIPQIEALLGGFRKMALPVIHVQTLIHADGMDSMPHWKRQGLKQCVSGTPGAMAPTSLTPSEGEDVVGKRYFSGFESGGLDDVLRHHGVDTLIVAGLYTHGCIRATVIDAYQKGYTIHVAEDCIASTDTQHALLSREWLDGRAASFQTTGTILAAIGAARPAPHGTKSTDVPAARIAGNWITSSDLPACEQFDPCDTSRLLARVPLADPGLVDQAVRAAQLAGRAWSSLPATERAQMLEAWAQTIAQRRDEWAAMIARQIGKPIADAREEMERTLGHIRSSARLLAADDEKYAEHDLRTRHCPRGVVAVITPWNNPVAIPVAKIASALAFGNSVVWKPALPAPHLTMAVVASLAEAGIPAPLLSLVFGDVKTAHALIAHPGVAAVTLTGARRAGLEAASLCARRTIPLQAELGGNNAAIVMADADLGAVARALALSAFGFAGQRCTATRRIVVDHSVRERFTSMLMAEVEKLRIGDPLDPATQLGPMISAARRAEIMAAVARAVTRDGGRLLHGGFVPPGMDGGCWYLPTLVDRLAPDAALVREESFGPIAVIQSARNYDEAIALCNGVVEGLVASFFGHDEMLQRRFMAEAEAGILRLNPCGFPVAADAPFGGWKSSGIGPPEHGRWDREFFARPQAIYGKLP